MSKRKHGAGPKINNPYKKPPIKKEWHRQKI